MSFDVSKTAREVARNQKLTMAQCAVLLALADRADGNHYRCWPSLETIADDCRAARATVISSIKALKKMGLISVAREKTKKGHNRNLYTLLCVAPFKTQVTKTYLGPSNENVPTLVTKTCKPKVRKRTYNQSVNLSKNQEADNKEMNQSENAPPVLPPNTNGFLYFEFLKLSGRLEDQETVAQELWEAFNLNLDPTKLLETAIANHSKMLLPREIKEVAEAKLLTELKGFDIDEKSSTKH